MRRTHGKQLLRRFLRAATAALVGSLTLLSLGACTFTQEASDRAQYVIASGGTSGVYFNYGTHLAEILSNELNQSFTVAETAGSVDNLLRIGQGKAMIGFAQSDAAANALAGGGIYGEPIPIRAVAHLYDEYVHVVVREGSDLADLHDLAGRTVSLGARNSGVNLVAVRVLEAAGVDPTTGLTDLELGPDDAIEALRNGQIEAFFWVGGVPTPGLDELSADTPIRLLPIESSVVEQLNNEYSGAYRISEFPLGSYGWDEPTMTMTVPNYLVVAEGAAPDLVYDIVGALFASRSELARDVPTAALLDRRQAIFTDPIALHPGAAEYYVDTKR